MKKGERIESFVQGLKQASTEDVDPCYAGYFTCFNQRDYYEAHDVLEHLWLQCSDANRDFYKGLIQIAGGFVHLKKHYSRPHHYKYGRRLAPAVRLFELGIAQVGKYPSPHLRLDVASLLALCLRHIEEIKSSGFKKNPWRPESAPILLLLPAESTVPAPPASEPSPKASRCIEPR